MSSATSPPWSLAEVNAWDQETFTERLGPMFEGSPWIAAAAWEQRPFASREALHETLVGVVSTADEADQVALIQAHPDLVGRAALAGTLTRASTAEQQAAGLDPGQLSPDDITQFQDFNATYQARFGFPFVICARENTKATILAAFPTRIANTRSAEISTALAEIAAICWYRLIEAIRDDESTVDRRLSLPVT